MEVTVEVDEPTVRSKVTAWEDWVEHCFWFGSCKVDLKDVPLAQREHLIEAEVNAFVRDAIEISLLRSVAHGRKHNQPRRP